MIVNCLKATAELNTSWQGDWHRPAYLIGLNTRRWMLNKFSISNARLYAREAEGIIFCKASVIDKTEADSVITTVTTTKSGTSTDLDFTQKIQTEDYSLGTGDYLKALTIPEPETYDYSHSGVVLNHSMNEDNFLFERMWDTDHLRHSFNEGDYLLFTVYVDSSEEENIITSISVEIEI